MFNDLIERQLAYRKDIQILENDGKKYINDIDMDTRIFLKTLLNFLTLYVLVKRKNSNEILKKSILNGT